MEQQRSFTIVNDSRRTIWAYVSNEKLMKSEGEPMLKEVGFGLNFEPHPVKPKFGFHFNLKRSQKRPQITSKSGLSRIPHRTPLAFHLQGKEAKGTVYVTIIVDDGFGEFCICDNLPKSYPGGVILTNDLRILDVKAACLQPTGADPAAHWCFVGDDNILYEMNNTLNM